MGRALAIGMAILLVASISLPTATIADGSQARDPPPQVEIALLNPITGPAYTGADYASAYTAAAEIAIAHLNDKQDLYEFVLSEYDSGCSEDEASSSAQDIVDDGIELVVGAMCTSATMAANSVLSQHGIPHVSPMSSSPGLSDSAAYPGFFRVVPNYALQGGALASALAGAGSSYPALVDMSVSHSVADSFEVYWEDSGNSICMRYDWNYSGMDADFTSLVEDVIDAGCDSVVMVSYGSNSPRLVEELRGQDFSGSIVGGGGIAGTWWLHYFYGNVNLADGVLAAISSVVTYAPEPCGYPSSQYGVLTAPDSPYGNETLFFSDISMDGLCFLNELYQRVGDGNATAGPPTNASYFMGHFERTPVQNTWHNVTVYQDSEGGLWWENEAGVSWELVWSPQEATEPETGPENDSLYPSQRSQDFWDDCNNDSDCSIDRIFIHRAEVYDAITIVAEAFILSQMFGETLEDSLHYVGYHWEGASSSITFNEDGDIAGRGFDVCEFVHHSGNDTVTLDCLYHWDPPGFDFTDSELQSSLYGFDVWGDADGDGVGNIADAFPLYASEWADSDGDGFGDNSDAFPLDASEWGDADGDGVGNNADAFPLDANETSDGDHDGVGDNSDSFPEDPTEWADGDGDGVGDNADVFPDDATETTDTDGDGVGDNSDAFPDDPTERADGDGDGIGDNADVFPDDATETTDSDGDGVGDNSDVFPDDATETTDTDGDGVGDNSDAFPDDPTEWADGDGDGIGDNADVFPDDPTEWVDTDGDGVGDNADAFPLDAREWGDIDGDGVGNIADYFPTDASEWADSDNDGTGDNSDAFPDDPSEWADSDGDGVGDNADAFPDDPDKTEEGLPGFGAALAMVALAAAAMAITPRRELE